MAKPYSFDRRQVITLRRAGCTTKKISQIMRVNHGTIRAFLSKLTHGKAKEYD